MIGIFESPFLTAIGNRNCYRRKIENLTDNQLLRIFGSAKEKLGDVVLTNFNIDRQPKLFYAGSAAVDVLRERHGGDYIAEVTGVPQRKPLVERLYKASYNILKENLRRILKP